MSIPHDRTGDQVVVQLGSRTLSGPELRHELGGFELEGVAASLFGREGTKDRPAFCRGRRGAHRHRTGRLCHRDLRATPARGRRCRRPSCRGGRLGRRRVALARRIRSDRCRRGRDRVRCSGSGGCDHRPPPRKQRGVTMSVSDSPFLTPPFKQCALVVRDLDEAVRHWTGHLGDLPLDRLPARGAATQGDALPRQGSRTFRSATPSPGRATASSSSSSRSTGRASSPITSPRTAKGCTMSASTCPTTPLRWRRRSTRGFTPLQSARGFGAEGDGAFAYFQHPGVALIVELIEAPRVQDRAPVGLPPDAD